MSGIVSRLSVLGKVWLGLAAGALALIVFGLAAPGSSLFFPLVSLWCNATLFALALLVLRRAGVELDLFHKAVLVGLWAAAVLYFYWQPHLPLPLGLRKLHSKAVSCRSRLCPEHRRRLPVSPRFHHRGLYEFHHPVHRVPVLPERQDRRRLRILSGIQRTAQPAGA
jgi:hypothetical protein